MRRSRTLALSHRSVASAFDVRFVFRVCSILVVAGLMPLLISSEASALSGGSYVSRARFPGSIAFYLPKTLTKERCTAVQVAPSIFLTAAHCFDRFVLDGSSREIVFVSNEDVAGVTRTNVMSRHLIAPPTIHPDYYDESGLWARFKNKNFWNNVDLALIRIDAPLDGVIDALIGATAFHAGQPLVIGGYGPSTASAECTAGPCALRMGVQLVANVSPAQAVVIETPERPVFLTPGDSGGPAYELRRGNLLVVVAINQSTENLNSLPPGRDLPSPSLARVTHLTRLDHAIAWLRSNITRLKQLR